VTALRSFLRKCSGAAAAEFALVLPVALLLFFGILDAGRYVWTINEMEKAVQMGTRYAVATEVVPESLKEMDFTGIACPSGTLAAGATICKDALGTISCTKSGSTVTCACTESGLGSGTCPEEETGDVAAFDNIVSRMRVINPSIGSGDVTIKYSGSGIGFAGDPTTDDDGEAMSDVSPIVTVEIKSLSMRAMLLFGGPVRLPGFSYSQTLEDGDGAVAY
jgi:hypothetical protein